MSYQLATAILLARDECWVPYQQSNGEWAAVMDGHCLREMDSKKRQASIARLGPLLASGALQRVLVDCSQAYKDVPEAVIPRLLLDLHVPIHRMVLWI